MVRNISGRGFTALATALLAGTSWLSAPLAQAQTPATDPAAPVAPAADNSLLDDPVHIDELAAYLQTVSNSLCWEMHRFHREEPDFTEAYRPAKEIWQMAGGLRDAVRTGPVDMELLQTRVNRMNDLMSNVEKVTERWGDGLKPTVVPAEPRVAVTPGAGVDLDIPFVGGFRVGAPRVYVPDDAPPVLDRRRIHPNARGSKRALERELFGTRVALNYLMEDTGVGMPVDSLKPVDNAKPAPKQAPSPKPSPPPEPGGPALSAPVKISPPAAKRGEPVKK